MGPTTKEFHKETPENAKKMVSWVKFRVGEEFELNGETFAIRKITKKDIVIRPVDRKREK